MIFRPDALELIKARRKTQTRRPVDVIELEPLKVVPCRYHAGRVYKAQPGRGKKGELEITVMSVRQERLGEITGQDARREGFVFVAQFMRRWEDLHGLVDPDLLVWVITFAVGDMTDHFDRPRLLTSRSGHVAYETAPGEDGGHGMHRWPDADETHDDYTDQPHLAMPGEPEALTEQQLRPMVRAAHSRDELRSRQQAAVTPLADRVSALERRARSGDQEAERALFSIGQRLERVEAGRAREAAA